MKFKSVHRLVIVKESEVQEAFNNEAHQLSGKADKEHCDEAPLCGSLCSLYHWGIPMAHQIGVL